MISELLVTALSRIKAEGANVDASVDKASADMKAVIRTIGAADRLDGKRA